VLDPLGMVIAGVVRCRQGRVPSCVDGWYEESGGGTSVAVASIAHRCWRTSPAADGANVLDSIRRHLCVRGGSLAASPGIGVITKVGSRWRSSSASITTTHFSRGADGTGGTGSTVPRSEMVVLAKYQGRLGSAPNSAAEMARGDIMETD
jgi:hypothetical protein